MSDATTCPECGGTKRPEFRTCYTCGTDACPRCGGPKRSEFEVCYGCAVERDQQATMAAATRDAERSRQWSGCLLALAVVAVAVLLTFAALAVLTAA